ncbi:8828_t:CDS:2, partial [Gigaspora margarita]
WSSTSKNTKIIASSKVYIEANNKIENKLLYDFSTLSIGYTFQNWNDVDSFFEAYGWQFGFSIIKKRVKCDNNIIRYRALGCEFGGTYSPKKNVDINTYCDRQSKHQGCEWHVNLNFFRDATCITVTIFVDIHNHELYPEIFKYGTKFWSIGKDALKDIEFYIKNRHLSITTQRQLLKAKYSDTVFLDTDIANAIQHFKLLISDETVESYKWILECTKKVTGVEPLVFMTDADPAIDSAIKQVYKNTRSLYCIYHINQNLPKNLKAVLGNTYNQFIREFFHCYNTLFEIR